MALTQVQGGMLAGSTNTTTTIQSNGTTAITIDSSQNVGIGTSSPSQKLDVAGDTRVSNSTGNKRFYIGQATPSANDGGSLEFQNSSTQINWAIRTNFNVAGALEFCPSSAAGGVSYTTPSMIVTNAGNVGIGTTSPTFSSGTGVQVKGAAFTNVRVTSASSIGTDFAQDSSGNGYMFNRDNAALIYGTNNTERMRVSSGGTLFIGATSSPNGTQRLVLTADGNAGTEPLLINELRAGNSNENAIRFYRNGSQVGTITTNASNTSYNTSSDYRLKENIAPMTGALAKVQQLKPCTYTWKVDGSAGQGFIAHELQAVVPDAVNGEKDAVDAEGKPVYQGIDTSFLVATLTAAIQELKAELDATKAEVAALKAAP